MPTLSNNELKMLKSLSQKKFRDEYRLFIVEGDKMVEEACRSDFEVVNVYHRDEIGETAMGRISSLSTPSPSLAVVRQPEEYRKAADDIAKGAETEVVAPSEGLVVALDSIRDPGNLGTILRTADWFGLRDVYASADTVEVFNPKVVQATMGSIFRVKLHYCNLVSLAERVKSAKGLCFGTFMDGEDIFCFDFPRKMREAGDGAAVIVIGNEANGISEEVAAVMDYRIGIPQLNSQAESLNAATAAGIAIAEYCRQMKTTEL